MEKNSLEELKKLMLKKYRKNKWNYGLFYKHRLKVLPNFLNEQKKLKYEVMKENKWNGSKK